MSESRKPPTSIRSAGAATSLDTVPVTADPNTTDTDMLDHLIRIVTTCREQLAVVNDGLERYDHTLRMHTQKQPSYKIIRTYLVSFPTSTLSEMQGILGGGVWLVLKPDRSLHSTFRINMTIAMPK